MNDIEKKKGLSKVVDNEISNDESIKRLGVVVNLVVAQRNIDLVHKKGDTELSL